jgi:hypothetical protein
MPAVTADTGGSVAILTRYVGPTDTKGSRIIASVPERLSRPGALSTGAYRLTISYDSGRSSAANHADAAAALADRLGWTGRLTGGATGDGYAFVFTTTGATE